MSYVNVDFRGGKLRAEVTPFSHEIVLRLRDGEVDSPLRIYLDDEEIDALVASIEGAREIQARLRAEKLSQEDV